MIPRDSRGTYLASRKFQLDPGCPGDVSIISLGQTNTERRVTNDHPKTSQKPSSLCSGGHTRNMFTIPTPFVGDLRCIGRVVSPRTIKGYPGSLSGVRIFPDLAILENGSCGMQRPCQQSQAKMCSPHCGIGAVVDRAGAHRLSILRTASQLSCALLCWTWLMCSEWKEWRDLGRVHSGAFGSYILFGGNARISLDILGYFRTGFGGNGVAPPLCRSGCWRAIVPWHMILGEGGRSV